MQRLEMERHREVSEGSQNLLEFSSNSMELECYSWKIPTGYRG